MNSPLFSSWSSRRWLFAVLCLAAGSVRADGDRAEVSAALSPQGGRIVFEAKGLPAPAPLFFTAEADSQVNLQRDHVVVETRLQLRVLQGTSEAMSVELLGDGDVVAVTGEQLRDWALRRSGTQRFLDLRATAAEADNRVLRVTATVKSAANASAVARVPLLGAGAAISFAGRVTLQPAAGVDYRVTSIADLEPLAPAGGNRPLTRYSSTRGGRLEVQLRSPGAPLADAELMEPKLTGQIAPAARTVEFQLHGRLKSIKPGARLRLLSQEAAVAEPASGAGWHLELTRESDAFWYELVADKAGEMAIDVRFAVALRSEVDWHRLEFRMPAGSIVPLTLGGLPADVTFDNDRTISPVRSGDAWIGFLPASGNLSVGWKTGRTVDDAALFFTSSEQSEIRIGAGLLRQEAQLTLRVMQGKLAAVRLTLDGSGEILSVAGANVVGWNVAPGDANQPRVLDVRFSRPVEGESTLIIRSQTVLDDFPVRARPIRFAPEGAVRHSGLLRLAALGAVRLEVVEASGVIQLAPNQFPGDALDDDEAQVFVYRFPAAQYDFRVVATPIRPEVSVSQVTTYALTETDRVIEADLELEVREAAVREWSFQIPADYTLVALSGTNVADSSAESETHDGYRGARVIFAEDVQGRHLLKLRLEKNVAAAAGAWTLPPLRFPGAKSVRGHVGLVSAPGYRLVATRADALTETPLEFFPRQTAGLQHTWRLKDAAWAADVRIDALGQSIQSDVYHLYSLKEGVVYGSVLINYFVVGAPATEWRLAVPEHVGNIDVVGQNVRRDWRREGSTLVIALHQPVLGAATLLLTFEQSLGAQGGELHPGEIRPLNVQAERGYLQVVSPVQVSHELTQSSGALLKLEPRELPTEYRLLTSAPSIAVYQYTGRPFDFGLKLKWFGQAPTIDQVAEYAQLTSQLSRDGQVATEAQYFVKTRGRQTLPLTLAKGTKLWEVRVNHEVVTARTDGDQILVPLPAGVNPNDSVHIGLRLGQPAGPSPSSIRLVAPALGAPGLLHEWTVRPETGRVLVPQRADAELLRPALTETGFEWIATRGAMPFAIWLAVAVLGALLVRTGGAWRSGGALAAFGVATALALLLALGAASQRPNANELTYYATLRAPKQALTIAVDHVAAWRAVLNIPGLVAVVAGAGLLGLGAMRRQSWSLAAGIVLVATGVLAQRGTAAWFFAASAIALLLGGAVPSLLRLVRSRRAPAAPGTSAAAAAAPVAGLMIVITLGLLTGPELRAAPAREGDVVRAPATVQTLLESWTMHDGRVAATFQLTVRGSLGETVPLLQRPAVLTEFQGNGLRLLKSERAGQAGYEVLIERDGVLTATGRYEFAVPDSQTAVALPTTVAAVRRLTIDLDQPGWAFSSAAAMKVEAVTTLAPGHSGATLTLSPSDRIVVEWSPLQRDIGAEKPAYFAELSQLYVPGPGAVSSTVRATIRPSQGKVAKVELTIPEPFTVGDVRDGPIGAWRFDPQTRRLHVHTEPAQAASFTFAIELQAATGELPFSVTLEPVRVPGALADVGLLALGFAGDAQSEAIHTAGLASASLSDVDPALSLDPRGAGSELAVQQAWRYGQAPGRVSLKVVPVSPEVRVASRQVLTFDDDRLVAAVDLNVAITRVGLFSLSFTLPEGLEVEALSGPALNHWTEANDHGSRTITLHLNGRTLGEQRFNLALSGPAPHAQPEWTVPRLQLREATRQTGELLLVPGKGLRLRAVVRENATALDPRAVGGLQPGTLAFRLLQADWALRVGIEAQDPWLTVQALQERTIREGQALTRVAARYRVENAAIKLVRVTLPGLSASEAATVRATGSAVSDFVRVGNDTWEIRFQRAVAGETDVEIEYQGVEAANVDRADVMPPVFVAAKQTTLFAAVRSGGRVEIEPADVPRGWQRVDWTAVPAMLRKATDREAPMLTYRVTEPEQPLAVRLRRHDAADALKLRVLSATLATLLAKNGAALTAVDLNLNVVEKTTLRIALPAGAQLYSTFVNGESANAVRDGAEFLFHVAPNTSGGTQAKVRVVFAGPGQGDGSLQLSAPTLGLPLEDVTWRVVLPPGYNLADSRGDLQLRETYGAGIFDLAHYQSYAKGVQSAAAKQASDLIEEATNYAKVGDQQRAGEVLSRAANKAALDEAANEDARVQLRELKTQQAVLGLTTRRQRLYLDHRADSSRNEQLEHAANLNPFMQGKTNFDPQQLDQLLMGNTVEENAVLRGIAARIVDQQLAAEPAPSAIEVSVAERGQVVTFARRLQVDGNARLQLTLQLRPTQPSSWPAATAIVAALGLVAVVLVRRR